MLKGDQEPWSSLYFVFICDMASVASVEDILYLTQYSFRILPISHLQDENFRDILFGNMPEYAIGVDIRGFCEADPGFSFEKAIVRISLCSGLVKINILKQHRSP